MNMPDFAKSVCGLMPSKEKAAQDAHMTPYESLAWTTALAIVRERMEGAHKSVLESVSTGIWHDYRRGRYEMARDILREMEERGKP
jgi:uncharacterized protein YqgV (UPF0045/DUF77 family)